MRRTGHKQENADTSERRAGIMHVLLPPPPGLGPVHVPGPAFVHAGVRSV